eukprot:Ihof_evm9s113 gene=Ihof_evmTU9s113
MLIVEMGEAKVLEKTVCPCTPQLLQVFKWGNTQRPARASGEEEILEEQVIGLDELSENVSLIRLGDDSESILHHTVDEEADNCYCGRALPKECSICWELMTNDRALFTTECGHMFHFSCLQINYQGGNVTCPLCRSSFYEPPVILQGKGSKDVIEAVWYVADITREETEILLSNDGCNGCYLVRQTHTTGKYCLSVHYFQNWHCRIFTNAMGEYFLHKARTFKTIAHLIDFYTT